MNGFDTSWDNCLSVYVLSLPVLYFKFNRGWQSHLFTCPEHWGKTVPLLLVTIYIWEQKWCFCSKQGQVWFWTRQVEFIDSLSSVQVVKIYVCQGLFKRLLVRSNICLYSWCILCHLPRCSIQGFGPKLSFWWLV